MASTRLLKGRVSQPGAQYVITMVLDRRRCLFRERRHASLVVDEIRRCAQEKRVVTQAWVIMPDHLHWMFQLREDALSGCVQAFKSRAARAINASLQAEGRIWQPGFHDHRFRDDDDDDLEQHARYLIANPLRKGLVQQIEDYPYWRCRWVRTAADL